MLSTRNNSFFVFFVGGFSFDRPHAEISFFPLVLFPPFDHVICVRHNEHTHTRKNKRAEHLKCAGGGLVKQPPQLTVISLSLFSDFLSIIKHTSIFRCVFFSLFSQFCFLILNFIFYLFLFLLGLKKEKNKLERGEQPRS